MLQTRTRYLVQRGILIAGVAGAAALTGCTAGSSADGGASGSATVAAPGTATSTTAGDATDCPLTVSDAWVKAADSGMTGEFGVLTNTSQADVTVSGGSSARAAMVELHEVSDGSMQPVAGGFVVPAGGSLTLEPGGYHIMLMQLTGPVAPGDVVETTLTCADGGTVQFTATAKDFAGGNEDYAGGSSAPMMSGS